MFVLCLQQFSKGVMIAINSQAKGLVDFIKAMFIS